MEEKIDQLRADVAVLCEVRATVLEARDLLEEEQVITERISQRATWLTIAVLLVSLALAVGPDAPTVISTGDEEVLLSLYDVSITGGVVSLAALVVDAFTFAASKRYRNWIMLRRRAAMRKERERRKAVTSTALSQLDDG